MRQCPVVTLGYRECAKTDFLNPTMLPAKDCSGAPALGHVEFRRFSLMSMSEFAIFTTSTAIYEGVVSKYVCSTAMHIYIQHCLYCGSIVFLAFYSLSFLVGCTHTIR